MARVSLSSACFEAVLDQVQSCNIEETEHIDHHPGNDAPADIRCEHNACHQGVETQGGIFSLMIVLQTDIWDDTIGQISVAQIAQQYTRDLQKHHGLRPTLGLLFLYGLQKC